MPRGSVHARLRSATAEQHRRLDTGLGYLLGEGLSRDRYANLLAAFLGFYAPLEDCLSEWVAASPPPPLPLVRRAWLLERDLLALGRAPRDGAECTEMPMLATAGQAGGALYVIEGACLGGQVIARDVAERFGIGRENGAAFFAGDGPRTGARWKHVLAWLEERGRGPAVADEIVAGARRTFAALSGWLVAREVLDE